MYGCGKNANGKNSEINDDVLEKDMSNENVLKIS